MADHGQYHRIEHEKCARCWNYHRYSPYYSGVCGYYCNQYSQCPQFYCPQPCPKPKETILAYLYSSSSFAAERGSDAPQLVEAMLKDVDLFDVKFRFVDINTEEWNLLLEDGKTSPILAVSALGSTLSRILAQLVVENESNIMTINTFSTINLPLLDTPLVMRLLPRDGVNGKIMAGIFNRSPSIPVVFLLEDENIWAAGLSQIVQTYLSTTPTILNLNTAEPSDVPTGEIQVLALGEPALPDLNRILTGRTDIRRVILGDASTSEEPTSEMMLTELQEWDTKVLLPNVPGASAEVAERLRLQTGLNNISSLAGVTQSALQIAVYLKSNIKPENYRTQDRIIGFEFEPDSLDNLTSIFTLNSYTKVSLPAGKVGEVAVSLLIDGIVKLFACESVN
jgi:hypothetical protein